MKLRYYLRGLAVGILLATVLLTVANADSRPLTDTEIRVRAMELGMVDGDSVRLSDLQGEGKADGGDADREDSEWKSGSDTAQDGSQEASDDGDVNSGGAQEPQDGDDMDGGDAQEPQDGDDTNGGDAQESLEDDDADSNAVTVQIRNGDSSDAASRALAEAGLVTDAAAYDAFLCDNGYSKTIRAGVYRIPQGAGWEEIARIIAR